MEVGEILKRVLITGANSYIGTHVEKWLMREPDKYHVETLDMKDPDWINFDFSRFDVVFHVAGIAHVSYKKNMKDLYFSINRDLAVQTAKLSKKSGVPHFIFMSSLIVFSSMEKIINYETKPKPDNYYGLSKLQAEYEILSLQSDTFRIAILRPPMIYGPGSKGNFPKLIKLSKLLPIFPKTYNKRSMLYIDNLSLFVSLIIKNFEFGYFYPQNNDYSDTSMLIKLVRSEYGRKTYLFRGFSIILHLMTICSKNLKKVFGSFYVDLKLSEYTEDYSIIGLTESIGLMVKKYE